MSDRSGRHILIVLDHSLYRWSEGETEPTKIADGVIGAAWIPDAAAPPRDPAPDRVAAITDQGALVVVDAANGKRIRTLASGTTVNRGRGELAPTPDGQQIYFTGRLPPDPATSCEGAIDVILRVDVAGGTVGNWGRGSSVAISPDGQWLARALESDQPCGRGGPLVSVQNTRTGEHHEFAGTTGVISRLSWSQDSGRLAFQWAKGSSYAYVLDTTTATSLDDAVCVCDQSDAHGWHGYLGTTGDFLGTRAPAGGSSEPARVVALRPDGTERRELFSWGGPIDEREQ